MATNQALGSAGVPQQPSVTDAIIQILNNQHALMAQLSHSVAETQVAISKLSRDETVLDSLASNMVEFADLFDKDADKLDDAAKVRLFLRKLSPPNHERYNSFILPKLAREFTFTETVEKLKSLFGASTSIFRRRYNCLQTTKEDSEDYLAYSCRVNKSCVDFKLSEVTEEQFKCPTFVCGLKSKQDAEIRMRLINKLNEAADLTLQQVVEQCNNLVNLKMDTVMVENPPTVNFVHRNQQQSRHRSTSSTPSQHREQINSVPSKRDPTKHRKKRNREQSTKTVTVRNIHQSRKFIDVQLNGVPLRLQLDTGSDISIISHQSWVKLGRPRTQPALCRAKTASGEPRDIVSELQCSITLNNITREGIDLMDQFGLWNQPITAFCNQVAIQQTQDVSDLRARFPDVFTTKMCLCNKTPIQLVLKDNFKPVLRPKRPVAYSMQSVVEEELHRLESLGIIKKVDFSNWAAPIVVLRKPNGTVRICADYSTGLNAALEPNCYPLPLPEDIFTKMANCRYFSHIDLSDAYLQAQVDEASQPLLTINTHKGLYQYSRLSPGIKSAPGAFQQIMDAMLAGLECTAG
ncbi:uncharacterized protein K02A2.6-like [Sabethes cyaneus]|uniref:uncharacterized protein K02A2.6-like n=1 Tax=Sabethes cyaneus TaxID=53552 RepID=UPI00237DDA43|nr:uncharacterized protein K02A2.6-like [Sabethes cyaneus]